MLVLIKVVMLVLVIVVDSILVGVIWLLCRFCLKVFDY